MIQIGRLVLGRIRVREFLQRAHQTGDAFDTFQRLFDRLGQLAGQVRQIGFVSGSTNRLRLVGPTGTGIGRIHQGCQVLEDAHQVFQRIAEKPQVVTDELDGRVDLMGDAGRQLSDRLQLLREAQLGLDALPIGDLGLQRRGLFLQRMGALTYAHLKLLVQSTERVRHVGRIGQRRRLGLDQQEQVGDGFMGCEISER